MRDLVASTADRPGVLGGIGGFGGLFELPAGYRRPVLVSSTDGVGTKMAVAMATGRFDTIGIDLVAMCVDDLVCCGARPLFFLDYQLLGRVDPDQVRAVMTGIAAGCRTAGCAIVGGELAEHPGLLAPGELDVAGFAVGIVERDAIIDGPARTAAGDVLSACRRPGCGPTATRWPGGPCSSVAGRSLLDGPAWEGPADWTLADELLRPSVIYTPAVLALLDAVEVHAIAHITGGGLPGNVPRVLGAGPRRRVRARSLARPADLRRDPAGRRGGRRRDGPGVQPRPGHGRRRTPSGRSTAALAALAAAGQEAAGGRAVWCPG